MQQYDLSSLFGHESKTPVEEGKAMLLPCDDDDDDVREVQPPPKEGPALAWWLDDHGTRLARLKEQTRIPKLQLKTFRSISVNETECVLGLQAKRDASVFDKSTGTSTVFDWSIPIDLSDPKQLERRPLWRMLHRWVASRFLEGGSTIERNDPFLVLRPPHPELSYAVEQHQKREQQVAAIRSMTERTTTDQAMLASWELEEKLREMITSRGVSLNKRPLASWNLLAMWHQGRVAPRQQGVGSRLASREFDILLRSLCLVIRPPANDMRPLYRRRPPLARVWECICSFLSFRELQAIESANGGPPAVVRAPVDAALVAIKSSFVKFKLHVFVPVTQTTLLETTIRALHGTCAHGLSFLGCVQQLLVDDDKLAATLRKSFTELPEVFVRSIWHDHWKLVASERHAGWVKAGPQELRHIVRCVAAEARAWMRFANASALAQSATVPTDRDWSKATGFLLEAMWPDNVYNEKKVKEVKAKRVKNSKTKTKKGSDWFNFRCDTSAGDPGLPTRDACERLGVDSLFCERTEDSDYRIWVRWRMTHILFQPFKASIIVSPGDESEDHDDMPPVVRVLLGLPVAQLPACFGFCLRVLGLQLPRTREAIGRARMFK